MELENKLYVVVHENRSQKDVHYIAVADPGGTYRLVNLNTYKLLSGSWNAISSIRKYFNRRQDLGELRIEYIDDLLKFTQGEN